MDRHTVTAFFDDRENANNANLRLRRRGVFDESITLSPEAAATGYAEETPAHVKRYWAAFDNLFSGSADRSVCAEAVRRGLVMLTARVDRTQIDDVAAMLERCGSIDLSPCETAWRAEGWQGGSMIAEQAVACPDARLLRSDSAATSKRNEASAGVRHAASAIDASRTGASTGSRVEHRGKVRIHCSVIETMEVSHRHETGSELGQSTPLHSEDSRMSKSASAALADGTPVQRAKNLEVVGSDGQHVGIIDHVAGTVIRLKCGDATASGIHHVIPTMWVQFIDEKVTLKFTAEDAMNRWKIA